MGDQYRRPTKFSATGNAGQPTGGAFKGYLTPAAAVATLDVRGNGSGGTIIASLQAAAGGQSVEFGPFQYEGQLHLTLTGVGASVTVVE